jgi:hypothetical protein
VKNELSRTAHLEVFMSHANALLTPVTDRSLAADHLHRRGESSAKLVEIRPGFCDGLELGV